LPCGPKPSITTPCHDRRQLKAQIRAGLGGRLADAAVGDVHQSAGFGIIVPLLPFYAKSFQAPPWQVALIFSAYAIGGFFGEPFWGRLSTPSGASRS